MYYYCCIAHVCVQYESTYVCVQYESTYVCVQYESTYVCVQYESTYVCVQYESTCCKRTVHNGRLFKANLEGRVAGVSTSHLPPIFRTNLPPPTYCYTPRSVPDTHALWLSRTLPGSARPGPHSQGGVNTCSTLQTTQEIFETHAHEKHATHMLQSNINAIK